MFLSRLWKSDESEVLIVEWISGWQNMGRNGRWDEKGRSKLGDFESKYWFSNPICGGFSEIPNFISLPVDLKIVSKNTYGISISYNFSKFVALFFNIIIWQYLFILDLWLNAINELEIGIIRWTIIDKIDKFQRARLNNIN